MVVHSGNPVHLRAGIGILKIVILVETAVYADDHIAVVVLVYELFH